MVKIQVKDPSVTERSGNKAGRAWHMRTQSAWAYLPSKPFPVEVSITLSDSQAAFAAGDYVLDGRAAWVGKYGELNFDLSKMQPIVAAAKTGT